MFWWSKPKEPLKPGICECGHARCLHKKGTGRCNKNWGPSDKHLGYLSVCACEIYIPKKDDNDDDPQPDTPSPSELEALYQR